MPIIGPNAEGFCPDCGARIGISGQCGRCAYRALEDNSLQFWKSLDLAWWRRYWQDALKTLEGLLKRPITREDKTALLKYWREHRRSMKSLGLSAMAQSPSSSVLAMLYVAMGQTKEPPQGELRGPRKMIADRFHQGE